MISDNSNVNYIKNKIGIGEIKRESDWYYLCYEIKELEDRINKSQILNYMSRENAEYIYLSSYILPLVYANNKTEVLLNKPNIYTFINTDNKYLEVNDSKNTMYDSNNKKTYDIFNYLMEKENIDVKTAINLVAQIYLFDIGTVDHNLDTIVNKYQNIIISDECFRLLCRGYYKLREVNTILDVPSYFQYRIDTIDRVKTKKYDPNFKLKD